MSHKELKLQLFKNIGIISLINFVSKIATIITAIILARLLEPSDFGIYGLALSVMAFVLIFDDMGLRSAVIQKKADEEETLFFTGFLIKCVLSGTLFLTIVFFVAPLSARFYETCDIKNVTILLAVIMLIDNFRFIPRTSIIKSNNFRKLLVPSVLENISYSVIVILLACWGFKYWSFVYAKIVSSVIGVILFFFVAPWKPHMLFSTRLGKELIAFGKFLVLAGLLGMVNKQMDNLIVGKLLGLSALGYYAIAYRWGNMFPTDIGAIINQTLYPVNVKYQDDLAMLEKIQVKSMKYASLVILPLSFGLLSICPEFVKVALGKKWAASIVPLQIMCIHGLFWGLVKRGNLLEALGEPKCISYLSFLHIIVFAILIFPLTKTMGIVGTAAALTLTIFVVNFLVFWMTLSRKYNFQIGTIWCGLVVPFCSSLIMVLGIYSLKYVLYGHGVTQLTVLVLSVATGVIVYSLCVFLLMRKDLVSIMKVFLKQDLSMKEKLEIAIVAL